MSATKIQKAEKICRALHENVYLNDVEKIRFYDCEGTVYDKIQYMIDLYDDAQLPFSDKEMETLKLATYLRYSQNHKYISVNKKPLDTAFIQKEFGDEMIGFMMSFGHLDSASDLTQEEIWIKRSNAFKEKKSDGVILPENKIAECILMADLTADLRYESPYDMQDTAADKCDSLLSKMILMQNLKDVSPYIAQRATGYAKDLFASHAQQWQRDLHEQGNDHSVICAMLNSCFVHVKPVDNWGRDAHKRASVKDFITDGMSDKFVYDLNETDTFLADRVDFILNAAFRFQPVQDWFVGDLLHYVITAYPEQGKIGKHNSAATLIGKVLIDHIDKHADAEKLQDTLLTKMPQIEGLEDIAESINAKKYIFKDEAMQHLTGTPRTTEDCYAIKEAVLMSYNSHLINYAREKIDSKKGLPYTVKKHDDEVLLQHLTQIRSERIR